MAKTDPGARPRRAAPARPGHRETKALLTLGAGAAILAGWLALARETPTASAAAVAPPIGGAAPASTARAQTAPGRSASQAQPRPITRTRSSR